MGWWDGSAGKGASCRAWPPSVVPWDPHSVKEKTHNETQTVHWTPLVCCGIFPTPYHTHTHKMIITNPKLSNFFNTHLKNLLRFLDRGALNIHYLVHELVPNNTSPWQWKNMQALSEHHKWFSRLRISLVWNLEGRARRGICALWGLWHQLPSRSHLSEINTVGLISG